jgi:hypothetical protein
MPEGALRHKWVVAGERSRVEDDDRAEATRALREMISEGKLTKLMPMKGEGGQIETVTITQDGPIAFTESTTLTQIFEEDANRCLILQTDEREEQTRRIVRELAARHTGMDSSSSDRVKLVHHALQRMLPVADVCVPFAERIAEQFDCRLHHRQRGRNDSGSIVATITDYQIARRLIAKPFAQALGGGVSDSALQFHETMKLWPKAEFTSKDAVKRSEKQRSSVYAWLGELHDAGAIELVEAGRGRTPHRWKMTDQAPDVGRAIIPDVADVFPESRTHGRKT